MAMSFNEYYIDPVSGNDTTGDGSKSTPWATLQKGLDTVTARTGSNADRFNMKDSGGDVLSSALSLATYGSPTDTAPLVIQGYTTDEGDGGIGEIDGNNSVAIISEAAIDYVCFIDMKLHNTGANSIVTLDDFCMFYNCEFTNNSSGDGIQLDNSNLIMNCKFSDIDDFSLDLGSGNFVAFNFFDDAGTATPAAHIRGNDWGNFYYRNIIKCKTGTEGIRMVEYDVALNNSVYASGNTAPAIWDVGTGGTEIMAVLNNIVSGFSGAGGDGFDLDTSEPFFVFGGNHTHNCATDYSSDQSILDLGDNDTDDGTAPFADGANDDFEPQDVASIKKGAAAGSLPHDADAWRGT